jgi:hypothetical protein
MTTLTQDMQIRSPSWICWQCDAVLDSKVNLDNHRRKEHQSCTNLQFDAKPGHVDAELISTGNGKIWVVVCYRSEDNKFECAGCNARFGSAKHLKRHIIGAGAASAPLGTQSKRKRVDSGEDVPLKAKQLAIGRLFQRCAEAQPVHDGKGGGRQMKCGRRRQ